MFGRANTAESIRALPARYDLGIAVDDALGIAEQTEVSSFTVGRGRSDGTPGAELVVVGWACPAKRPAARQRPRPRAEIVGGKASWHLCLQSAGPGHRSDATQRPLISVLQSSPRAGPLRIIEPPFLAADRSAVDNPKRAFAPFEAIVQRTRNHRSGNVKAKVEPLPI
jgi:hypothetical protein